MFSLIKYSTYSIFIIGLGKYSSQQLPRELAEKLIEECYVLIYN